jgi:hypothetical protein
VENYKEISGLDKRLVTIEKTIESVPGKVAEFKTIADAIGGTSDAMRSSSDSMRSTVTTLGDEIRNIPKSPASTGEAPGTLNILVFDEKQQALIKEIFPKDVSAASEQIDRLRIGEFVQDPSLQKLFLQIPPNALSAIPQLQATLFAVGHVQIVFARLADDRVVGSVMR